MVVTFASSNESCTEDHALPIGRRYSDTPGWLSLQRIDELEQENKRLKGELDEVKKVSSRKMLPFGFFWQRRTSRRHERTNNGMVSVICLLLNIS